MRWIHNCPLLANRADQGPEKGHIMNKEMTPQEFKAERERLKITAKQFGQLLGVSERAVFYYEHGQRKIPKPIQLLVMLYKKHAVVEQCFTK